METNAARPVRPDVVLHVCRNCLPAGARLPRQWKQDGAHVVVRMAPCGGKTDAQYIFHSLEDGCLGVCVVTCPEGECKLAQGNYRAGVRISTMKRLLAEVGMEPRRVELLRFSPQQSFDSLNELVRGAVRRFCGLGESRITARRQRQVGDDEYRNNEDGPTAEDRGRRPGHARAGVAAKIRNA